MRTDAGNTDAIKMTNEMGAFVRGGIGAHPPTPEYPPADMSRPRRQRPGSTRISFDNLSAQRADPRGSGLAAPPSANASLALRAGAVNARRPQRGRSAATSIDGDEH